MADVKFSELTELAAADVASDDILAVVDTTASTSKKLTINSLFGEVPVNIAVNDVTDTSSATTGSIQTDGGIGVAKKLYVGTTTTSVGKITSHNMSLDLGAAAAGTTTTVTSAASSTAKTLTLPNLTDTLVSKTSTDILSNKTLASPVITTQFSIGSAVITEAELEILDGALATTAELNTAADGSTTIGTTAVAAGDGLVTNDGGTMRQTTVATFDTYLSASTKTLTNKTLTTPKINEDVTVTTTATELNVMDGSVTTQATVTLAAADGVVISDGDVMKQCLVSDIDLYVAGSTTTALTGKTLTSPILTTPTLTTSIAASTNAADVIIKQYDGAEVARIHDGATAATLETGALDMTLAGANKGGFGFKRPVYNVTPGADDADLTLTMAHSGSIIMITGASYEMECTLPIIAAGDEGFHITFVITTVFGSGDNLEIGTAGHGDTTDTIYLYGIAGTASGSDVAGGDVVRTQDAAVVGTMLEFTCIQGGTNELWICKYLVPSGSAPTVEASMAAA